MAPVPSPLAPPVPAAPTSWRLVLAPVATHDGSAALGAGAVTTRDNHMVIGTANTEVTVPNLAGEGTAIIAANEDGTLQRSSVFRSVISITPSTSACPSSNQRHAASAMPWKQPVPWALHSQASLKCHWLPDEPMRCGFGAGGWGSQYSVAGGCAARVADRVPCQWRHRLHTLS